MYLVLPNRLIFNRLVSRLIFSRINQYSAEHQGEESNQGTDSIPAIPHFELKKEDVDRLCDHILLASKKFRGLVLLDVQDADGSSVLVRL